jgi:hypothetical protein
MILRQTDPVIEFTKFIQDSLDKIKWLSKSNLQRHRKAVASKDNLKVENENKLKKIKSAEVVGTLAETSAVVTGQK